MKTVLLTDKSERLKWNNNKNQIKSRTDIVVEAERFLSICIFKIEQDACIYVCRWLGLFVCLKAHMMRMRVIRLIRVLEGAHDVYAGD